MIKFIFYLRAVFLIAFVPFIILKSDDIKATYYGNWILMDESNLSLIRGLRTIDGLNQVMLGISFDEGIKDWTLDVLVNASADKSEEILIAFPNGTKHSLPIDVCREQNCVAHMLKNIHILTDQFKNNPDFTITFIDKKLGKITFLVTLDGFKEGYAALQEKHAAAGEKLKTSKPKSTAYNEWALEYFDYGKWSNIPSLGSTYITISEDPIVLQIKIYSIQDTWIVSFIVFDIADQAKGVTLTLPNASKRNIQIDRCTDTYCGSTTLGKEAEDILQDLLSASQEVFLEEHEASKSIIRMNMATLTFTKKTTNAEVSLPFSVRGLNEAYKALKKVQKSTHNKN